MGGCDRWKIIGCDFEGSGRGLITSNGFHNTVIANNYFARSGDDCIGVNGVSHNVTISANVFEQAATQDTTPACAIKCTGQGISIVGNTMYGCHSGINLEGGPGFSYEQGAHNGEGGCRDVTVSGNAIYQLYNHAGKISKGIRIQEADGVTISDNIVVAIDNEGTPREVMQLQDCRDVVSRGNRYVGAAMVMYNSNLISENDIFQMLDDKVVRIRRPDATSSLEMVNARVSKNVLSDNLYVVEQGDLDVIDLSVSYTFGCRRIGYIKDDVQPGSNQINLTDVHKHYAGLQVSRAAGQKILITDGTIEEFVTLNLDAPMGSLVLNIEPTTNGPYLGKKAWLEFV